MARQRPQTAKGYVFVLCEDEDGPVNVIVKPDIYQRDRTTIRMEPFVAVRGRLQKDGETINVIAYEVKALRLGGGAQAMVPKPGPTRSGVSIGPEVAVDVKAAQVGPGTPNVPPADPVRPGPANTTRRRRRCGSGGRRER